MESKFNYILKEAEKDFEQNMNWMDFSNKYFSQGSNYNPATKNKEDREEYLNSEVFQKIMDMKYELEEQQENVNQPEIKPLDDYSGRTNVRIPKSLHRDLYLIARKEGISLNQTINMLLIQQVAEYNNKWQNNI